MFCMKVLVVIDMQNDFIDGELGTEEAKEIVPKVKEKILKYRKNGNEVVFTRDTHDQEYLFTAEGKALPTKHCIKGTHGWQITSELDASGCKIINKSTFGSVELSEYLSYETEICEAELVGLCTDMCVISNALLLKAFLPECRIAVDSSCCAGSDTKSHEQALKVMEKCQVEIR